MKPSLAMAAETASALTGAVGRIVGRFDVDQAELAAYVDQRQLHLAAIAGEPGYDEAVEAEAINVALFAAGQHVSRADAMDRELLGIARTGLLIAVRVLLA